MLYHQMEIEVDTRVPPGKSTGRKVVTKIQAALASKQEVARASQPPCALRLVTGELEKKS